MTAKGLVFSLWLVFLYKPAYSQQAEGLPITVAYHADTAKPLLVYISGDGGINKFSSSLLKGFQSLGYGVVALNAKEYFWNKKTPEKTTADVSNLITRYLKEWNRRSFIIIGYSFGADVSPFIMSRLAPPLAAKAKQLVMIAPSESTTFEIKLIDMLGWGSKNGQDVVAELNKVQKPVLLVMAKDDKSFPVSKITIPGKQVLQLSGGHHFDGDADVLSRQIQARLTTDH